MQAYKSNSATSVALGQAELQRAQAEGHAACEAATQLRWDLAAARRAAMEAAAALASEQHEAAQAAADAVATQRRLQVTLIMIGPVCLWN